MALPAALRGSARPQDAAPPRHGSAQHGPAPEEAVHPGGHPLSRPREGAAGARAPRGASPGGAARAHPAPCPERPPRSRGSPGPCLPRCFPPIPESGRPHGSSLPAEGGRRGMRSTLLSSSSAQGSFGSGVRRGQQRLLRRVLGQRRPRSEALCAPVSYLLFSPALRMTLSLPGGRHMDSW